MKNVEDIIRSMSEEDIKVGVNFMRRITEGDMEGAKVELEAMTKDGLHKLSSALEVRKVSHTPGKTV